MLLGKDSLVRNRGWLTDEEVAASRPLLDRLPYPVMQVAASYATMWMNEAAITDYGRSEGSCHAISHGRDEPCHQAGEQCPKRLAEEHGTPASVNHVHVVRGGVEIYKVIALPIREGGVLEMHIPLEDVLARDGLTGLYARDFFWMLASRQLALLERMGSLYSVILFDLDLFKRVNDEHGHAVGDDLLRATGAMVNAEVRAADTAGRLGGEEFGVFLPNTGAQQARAIAERLRQRVRAIELADLASGMRVSASFGVYAAQSGDSLETALERADAALYRAKRAGRDRIELA